MEFRQIRKKFLEFKLKQHGIGDKEFEAKALNIADAVTIVALNADAANSSFKLFLEDIKKYFANEWKWDRLPISEVKRYNEGGQDSLRDLRHDNPGEACVLSERQQASLEKALTKDAPGVSLWTGSKVAQWIAEKTKVKVHASTGWRYLVRLDHSLQVPRPRHKKAAPPEEQAAFKKN